IRQAGRRLSPQTLGVKMNESEALEIARIFLRGWLDVRPRVNAPAGIYDFDPNDEILFEVVCNGPFSRMGAAVLLAVSKSTGAVRHVASTEE
ncbi:MAG: hypothetical protein KDF61_18105, partial [Rhodocyclaceae bacterium]|nr:hypothetical protein [Rhodocyclaceae bacterium]